MCRWIGGPTYVNTFPPTEVRGLTPAEPIKVLTHQPNTGCHVVGPPSGTLSFTKKHATCRPGIGPCIHSNSPFHVITLCHVSSPHQQYSRTVSCHMACTDCIINIFLLVWENRKNTISLSYELCLIPFKLDLDRE
jgi:hypothetical protein